MLKMKEGRPFDTLDEDDRVFLSHVCEPGSSGTSPLPLSLHSSHYTNDWTVHTRLKFMFMEGLEGQTVSELGAAVRK